MSGDIVDNNLSNVVHGVLPWTEVEHISPKSISKMTLVVLLSTVGFSGPV